MVALLAICLMPPWFLYRWRLLLWCLRLVSGLFTVSLQCWCKLILAAMPRYEPNSRFSDCWSSVGGFSGDKSGVPERRSHRGKGSADDLQMLAPRVSAAAAVPGSQPILTHWYGNRVPEHLPEGIFPDGCEIAFIRVYQWFWRTAKFWQLRILNRTALQKNIDTYRQENALMWAEFQ